MDDRIDIDLEWRRKAELLRDEAWRELMNAPAYAAFKAFDDAVVAVGGTSVIPYRPLLARLADGVIKAARALEGARRVSHADAAEAVLREQGPLTALDLLSAVPNKGATVGGEKPIVNLTSTLSKDARFRSVRANGSYFWWFADEPLPLGWNEPAGRSLLDEPAGSSVSSSSEGGDGLAPATT